jgi:hypothetical protein
MIVMECSQELQLPPWYRHPFHTREGNSGGTCIPPRKKTPFRTFSGHFAASRAFAAIGAFNLAAVLHIIQIMFLGCHDVGGFFLASIAE